MSQTVHFSNLLPIEYSEEWTAIKYALESRQIDVKLLEATKDIWCRDYMPITNRGGELIQFRYEPSYLKNRLDLQSNPQEVLKANEIKAKYSNINFDGGNVIQCGKKAIITDRVVIENPEYSNKYRLFQEIEELLQSELLVMPSHKQAHDMTGHIDGMMRFVDEDTLIGNDLNGEFKYMSDKIIAVLKEHSLDYIPMPFYEDKSTDISALGIYVNYLELDQIILFPIFEQKENIDKQALEIITATFPSKEIIPVNINAIAKDGGLMNCLSWLDVLNEAYRMQNQPIVFEL